MSIRTCTLPALAAVAAIGATAPGAHAATATTPSAFDVNYLKTSIQGDRFEIDGGKIAEQRGSTAAVKAYGARLVKDHTKSLKEAKALAKKLGIKVPTAPTQSEQWELGTIASFSGTDFDQRYADLETMDHQQDISEAQDEIKMGTSAAVIQAARKEIPTLKTHLKIARSLGGRNAKDPGA
jgi:putative membrane protein